MLGIKSMDNMYSEDTSHEVEIGSDIARQLLGEISEALQTADSRCIAPIMHVTRGSPFPYGLKMNSMRFSPDLILSSCAPGPQHC